MTTESPIPVWIKLVTNETLYCEMLYEDRGIYFVRHPYLVNFASDGKGRTNILLSEWVPYSSKNTVPITATNVIAIGNLQKDNKELFGDVVLQNEMTDVKHEIFELIKKTHILPSHWINEKYEKIMAMIIDNAKRFDRTPPPLEELTETFYSFIMKFNEPETSARN